MSFWKLFRKGIKKKFGWIAELIKKILKIALVIMVTAGLSAIFHFYTNEDLLRDTTVMYSYYEDECVNIGINDNVADRIRRFINDEDKVIRDKFYNQNWKIVLSNGLPPTLKGISPKIIEIEKEETNGNIVLDGLTVPTGKIIYVNTDNRNDEYIYKTFLHEYGHFIDYEFGYPSVSSAFEDLYDSFKGCEMYNEYETESSTEFFAASIMYYHLEPNNLKGRLPDVYQYIDNLLTNKDLGHFPFGERVTIDTVLSPVFIGVSSAWAKIKLVYREFASQLWA